MKRFLTVLLLLVAGLAPGAAQAQEVYGNEWIDYSKTYYKLQVVENGLYKLDYAYLSGLGLENVNPQHLQLFRRGKEVAVYVAGEEDGRLDQQDYLEFYGERNDGVLDQGLYKNPEHQVHQLYSMYTDTAAYFLTVNPAGANKRMRVENPAVDGRTPQGYLLQKALLVKTDKYSEGKVHTESHLPWMDAAEGFFSSWSAKAVNFALPAFSNVEPAGPVPYLSYAVVGVGSASHNFNVNVVEPSKAVRQLASHAMGSYSFIKGKSNFKLTDIDTRAQLTVQLAPQSGSNAVSLAYVEATYPQKSVLPQSGRLVFYTDSTSSASPYFYFANAPASAVAYDVTASGDVTRIPGQAVNNGKGFVVRAENQATHKVLLADLQRALLPAKSSTVKFSNYLANSANYIILTSKAMMQVPEGSNQPVPEAYAAYRASEAGGKHAPMIVYVDDLVNQFHYGEFSPMGVKHFTRFMGSAAPAKHMLILGKGIEVNRISYRSAASRALDIVPVFGYPGSDLSYAIDFRNGNYIPTVAVGRVAVTTPLEAKNYLDKVKEYEALAENLPWRKKIMQLGGGASVEHMTQIANYLESYAAIAEGPLLGATVEEKYRKNLSEFVETLNISKEINSGVSLLTFFGHSSTSTTDLNIGYVSTAVNGYQNKGKYPVMLINGCNLGNMFVPNSVSFGEDWLKTKDKGAVALIAHVGTGLLQYLHIYSYNFYQTAFQNEEYYGKSLGRIQQKVISDVLQMSYSNNGIIAMVLEMALQGDPALALYSPIKPDYYVKGNSFSVTDLEGNPATASSDSVLINFTADNLGKAIPEELTVSVKRTLPDNSLVSLEPFTVEPIIKERTLSLKLPNSGLNALGMNAFEVMLDGSGEIDELDETNNTATFQYYFPVSGLRAVSPGNYAIVGERTVQLVAQTTVKDVNKGYYFEVDTTSQFNSPLLTKQAVSRNSILAVLDYGLPASAKDSTVFYWRARFDEYSTDEDTVWAESSFRYIDKVKNGWSQSQYAQFQEVKLNGFEELKDNKLLWDFKPTRKFINIKTVGGAKRFDEDPHGLFVDGFQYMSYFCGNPNGSSRSRFFFIVFNNSTLEPISSLGDFAFCPYIAEFDTGDLSVAANVKKTADFLNAVPEGYYVAAISINNVPFSSFSEEVKAAFRSIGSSLIDELKTGDPFAIVGQKGQAAGTAQETSYSKEEADRVGGTPANSQEINLDVTLESNRPSGTITSTVIGPALEWASLHHNIERYQGGDDKYTLSLIGINAAGEETVLQEDVTTKQFDLSGIDATQFPNLRLKAYMEDEVARTSPQLKEWFVIYKGVPEGVIRPDLVNASREELTQQANAGSVTVPMAFQNVTSTAFSDSVTVEVTLSGDGNQPTTTRFKIKPVGANETVKFSYSFQTQDFEGDYSLSLYVNPRLLPEQEYFNNVYEVGFSVKSKLHPIMDVAFDGIHILDGDIVSPSPLISVTVKDENQHVLLQDPSKMTMILISPEGQEQEIDLMGNPEVTYAPATEAADFKLEYKPAKLMDGIYKMEVRARDAAGKESGVSPYRIGFEVISEASVSNFYPFPNPFSTKTNFIFTITGSTIPEHMKIQILTITGKVVKEIMKEELGPLRIGNNKTEYAWDGTDTYGDKLANGVYLYRVIMSKGEEQMKHRNTFGDGAFKNGYGKLYILR
ncbi:C25 family cysteine peptidase [Pontibacter actiniarum]|nr:C25 family cysteine peptidase [Pontibacter actiniarum]